jgi:hypothetical protein
MELEKQDYILLIMNCMKYRNKALHQKETWLKDIPEYLIYYHVIGNPLMENEFEFDNLERILWIKCEDDYNSLPKKVIKAYKSIHKTFDYKYIFKTDDDQMLQNIKFFDLVKGFINKKEPTPQYGGNIVDVKQNYLSKYHTVHPELPKNLPVLITKYCSGRFYFLSKEAIKDLIYRMDLICDEYLEDYAIGYNLSSKFKIGMLHLETNKFFNDFSLD